LKDSSLLSSLGYKRRWPNVCFYRSSEEDSLKNILTQILVGGDGIDLCADAAAGDTYVEYNYTFNKDVALNFLHQSDPDFPDPYLVEDENGSRNADETYTFSLYWWDGYDYYVPRGTHTLRFQGSDADGSFDLTVNFTI